MKPFSIIVYVALFVTTRVTAAFNTMAPPKSNVLQKHLYSTKSNQTPQERGSKDYDSQITSCKDVLLEAVSTKASDPDTVLQSLESLEKLMRQKRKVEGEAIAQDVLNHLGGQWRLIFTTGTKKTQDQFKTRINYFPLKAIQSFDTTKDPMEIQNAIYVGDFALVKFEGDFTFDLKKSKLEFSFDKISVFGITFNLGKGDAEKMGAASGLGSDSNVKNSEKNKKAFFNWISADSNIATARGGGGGLALWQRVQE
jgi:hypothetical protein